MTLKQTNKQKKPRNQSSFSPGGPNNNVFMRINTKNERNSVYFPTHREHNKINGTAVKGYRDERHQACLVGKQNCHTS